MDEVSDAEKEWRRVFEQELYGGVAVKLLPRLCLIFFSSMLLSAVAYLFGKYGKIFWAANVVSMFLCVGVSIWVIGAILIASKRTGFVPHHRIRSNDLSE